MKHIKSYKIFKEDATANASSTAGMGAVSAAQPGSVAGTAGTTGSGDIGFVFKKEKRKKGGPSQVSDLRDLKDVKTNVVKESVNLEDFTKEEFTDVKECFLDLFDDGFDLDSASAKSGTVFLNLVKTFNFSEFPEGYNTGGNTGIWHYFNKSGLTSIDIHKDWSIEQNYLLEMCDDAGDKLINFLNCDKGKFNIMLQRIADRRVDKNLWPVSTISIDFILERAYEQQFEAYNSEQEYINDIIGEFKNYNIRPLQLNTILNFYSSEIKDGYENNKPPRDFVDGIVKDMDLDDDKGFTFLRGGTSLNNRTVKYL